MRKGYRNDTDGNGNEGNTADGLTQTTAAVCRPKAAESESECHNECNDCITTQSDTNKYAQEAAIGFVSMPSRRHT